MDLRDLAGDIDPERAAAWMLRLAKALEQLHDQGRVHTRVGLAAVAVEDATPSSGARLVAPGELTARVDHHNPERLFGASADAADDVWAAGVALYQLLTGVLPYQAASELQVMSLIEAAPPAPISSHGCDHPELQALLDRVLTLDRAKRINTADELRVALSALVADDQDLPALDIPDLTDPSIAWAEQGGPTSARGGKSVPVADAPPDEEPSPADDAQADDGEGGDAEVAKAQAAGEQAEAPADKKKVGTKGKRSSSEKAAAKKGRSAKRAKQSKGERAGSDSKREGKRRGSRPSDGSTKPAQDKPADKRKAGGRPSTKEAKPSKAKATEAKRNKAEPSQQKPSEDKPNVAAYVLVAVAVVGGGVWWFTANGEPAVSSATPKSESRSAPAASRTPSVRATSGRTAAAKDVAPVRSVAVTAPAPATSAAPSASPAARPSAASSGAATAAPSATASAAPSSAPSSAAPSSAPPSVAPASGDATACMTAWMPSDTFGDHQPSFDALCSETDPVKAHAAIIAELVRGRGGRSITTAMTQWATLGWYEMAAVAVAQARCCSTPPKLSSAQGFTPCKLDDALVEIGKVARGADQAQRDAAIAGYATAIKCLSSAEVAFGVFGQQAKPGPHGLLQLRKLLGEER